MLLYPELPAPIANQLLDRLISLSLEEARQESNTKHPSAAYAATGGNRANTRALQQLQQAIRDIAQQYGYPEPPDARQKRDFDAATGKLLHAKMDITPSEASRSEMWNFLACVLLPEIVRWRFPGPDNVTTRERFLGQNRGMRNLFGRAWWRAYLLYQQDREDPYSFLYQLGEDELVQIMERTNIAGSPVLAKQICASFLAVCSKEEGISDTSHLLRDAMKRLRRLFPLVSFNALESPVLRQLIDDIFAESVNALFIKKASALSV